MIQILSPDRSLLIRYHFQKLVSLIFVSLEALEAIHKHWKAGIKIPNYKPQNVENNNFGTSNMKQVI